MLLQCANCGAPLKAIASRRTIDCAYCGRTNVVGSMTTLSMQVPPGWTPPPTWTPPSHFPEESVPLAYKPAQGAAVAVIVLALVGGIAAAGGVVFAVSGGRGSPALRREAWDGRSTLICNGNDTLTIRNKTADMGSQPAVVVNGACRLTLINCRVKGQPGIIANGPARVTVTGGSITGVSTAVIATDGATVEMRGGARLVGQVMESGGGRVIR